MPSSSECADRRLFFALWPPEQIAERIVERGRGLDLAGRAVPADKLHLTLAFHGRCDAEQHKRLIAAADAVAESEFELVFDRLGYFRGPRIVWFGMSTVPANLMRLADRLSLEGVDRGAFVPHISVMHKAEPAADRAIEPLVWPAREFALVESGFDGTAGAYRTLARWTLRHAGGQPQVGRTQV